MSWKIKNPRSGSDRYKVTSSGSHEHGVLPSLHFIEYSISIKFVNTLKKLSNYRQLESGWRVCFRDYCPWYDLYVVTISQKLFSHRPVRSGIGTLSSVRPARSMTYPIFSRRRPSFPSVRLIRLYGKVSVNPTINFVRDLYGRGLYARRIISRFGQVRSLYIIFVFLSRVDKNIWFDIVGSWEIEDKA